MRCNHVNCQEEATHSPKLCVPGYSLPLKSYPPYVMMIGLNLCEAHCLQTKPETFLDMPKIKEIFTLLAKDKVAPEFPRAFMVAVPHTSIEYKNRFQDAMKRMGKANTP